MSFLLVFIRIRIIIIIIIIICNNYDNYIFFDKVYRSCHIRDQGAFLFYSTGGSLGLGESVQRLVEKASRSAALDVNKLLIATVQWKTRC